MTILFIHSILHKNTYIYYITVAIKPHPVLTHIEDSCHLHGNEVKILGLKQEDDISWRNKNNFGIKLREVYRFIHNPELNDSDIVLFSDAYSVAVIGNQAEIKRRFLMFQKPIVFSGEKICHPDKNLASKYNSPYGAEFPYLNSGLFIGRVWALRRCMAEYKLKDNEDDQSFWTNQYFKHRELIELDHHARLFLTSSGLNEKTDIDWDHHKNLLTCNLTHSHPLMLHVPGKDKTILYSVIGRYNEEGNEKRHL
jgi:hypothetical protein